MFIYYLLLLFSLPLLFLLVRAVVSIFHSVHFPETCTDKRQKKQIKNMIHNFSFNICFNNFLIIFFTQPTPYSDIHSRVCFTTHNKRFKFTQHVFPLRSINMSSNNKSIKIHHETLRDGKHTNAAQSTNSKHLYTG